MAATMRWVVAILRPLVSRTATLNIVLAILAVALFGTVVC